MTTKRNTKDLESLFFVGCIFIIILGLTILFLDPYFGATRKSFLKGTQPILKESTPAGDFQTFSTGIPCCQDDLSYIWKNYQQEKEGQDYYETFEFLRAKERYEKYYKVYYEPFPPEIVAYETERIHYVDLKDYEEVHTYETYVGLNNLDNSASTCQNPLQC